MRIVVNDCNKEPVKIDREKLNRLYKRNVGLRNQSIFELYEKGVLPNPVIFDEQIIMKYIIQEHPKELKRLTSCADGTYSLNKGTVKLAYSLTDDEEFKEVAGVLIKYFERQEIVTELSKLSKKCHTKTKTEFEFNIRASVSQSEVNMRCHVNFMIPEVQKAIILPEGYSLDYLDLSEPVKHGISKYLGIDEMKYLDYRYKNKSLFIKGLTFNEELDYVQDLLEGTINADGDFGNLLRTKFLEYYAKTFNTEITSMGYITFAQTVYSHCFDMKEEQIDLFNFHRKGYRPFAVNNTGIYYLIKNNKQVEDKEVFCGNYALDWGTDKNLGVAERLSGMCGEYVSTEYLAEKGIEYDIVPVQGLDGKQYISLTDLNGVLEPKMGRVMEFDFKDEIDFDVNGIKDIYFNCNGLDSEDMADDVAQMLLAYGKAECGCSCNGSIKTKHYDLVSEDCKVLFERAESSRFECIDLKMKRKK